MTSKNKPVKYGKVLFTSTISTYNDDCAGAERTTVIGSNELIMGVKNRLLIKDKEETYVLAAIFIVSVIPH